MNSITLDKWNLNKEEIGYYVGKSNIASDSKNFNVYIPKILPLIQKGTASIRTEPISTSGIINASACMVSPSSSIKTQNYITVETDDNINFKRPVFKYGCKLRIVFTEKNIDSGRITNTIDSSSFDKKVNTV